MKRNRIEIIAIGPSQRSIFKKDTCKKLRVPERRHHRAVFCDNVREIALAFGSVRKPQTQPVISQLVYFQNLDDLDHGSSSGPGTRSMVQEFSLSANFP